MKAANYFSTIGNPYCKARGNTPTALQTTKQNVEVRMH